VLIARCNSAGQGTKDRGRLPHGHARPATLTALRRLHTEQALRRLALGVRYHADAERHRARQALGTDSPQDEYLVICKPDGRPYRPDSTSTQFRSFVDAHGLRRSIHVHTLRHSAASFPGRRRRARLRHRRATRPRRRWRAGAQGLHPPRAEGLTRAGTHLDNIIGGQA